MKTAGIYIHIPFCASKCRYCAFVSHRADIAEQQEYTRRLIDEIGRRSPYDGVVDTVYIGGGTPSFLYRGGMDKIMSAVRDKFRLADTLSFTAEANPDSLTPDKAREWAQIGVNRISIGLQSAHDKVIANAGRVHTLRDFERAVDSALAAGIKDISCDIMLGLPLDTVSGVRKTIEYIRSSGVITHVSAYGLKPEIGTAWQHLQIDEDLSADMYDTALAALAEGGYHRYEVSNFARKGYESAHNLKYWMGGDYIGLGAAAHSLVGGVRYANPESYKGYMAGESAVRTELDEDGREKEFLMLRLRLEKGFLTAEYNKLFGADFAARYKNALDFLTKYGLVIYDGQGIRVAPDKFGVLNQIIVKLWD